MDFGEAVKTCLRKYFTFSGRAQRSEYWWFYLFTIIVAIFAAIIDGAIVGWENSDDGPVGMLTSLALLIPSLSAGWRRLHDTGRSGWWIGGGILAIVLVVFAVFGVTVSPVGGISSGGFDVLLIVLVIGILIYAIAMLIFFCQDSEPNDNLYGPSPKYNAGVSVFD